MVESLKQLPIAIVAMGAKFPGRGTTSGFWRDVVEGVDTSSDIPETHWLAQDYYDPDLNAPDKTYSSRGAFIPAFPFDPIEFGTPPNVIETTDTVQLLALYVAKQVLAEAQPLEGPPVDLERTSVVLGVAAGTELIGDMASRLNRPIWVKAMREEGLARPDAEAIADRISSHYTEWRESTFPGLLGNVVAGRIANRFDLGGTNFTADAACASSLAAIRHAAQELWLGESDMVLAGGADALNNIFMFMCFSKTPAMSASGQCRPFSDDADGTLMGEGCGIFALRRLEDAERDGNAIHAIITGIGASSDGRGSSVYAPRASGQARAIRRALSKAGISPQTIELMEAHGTGTRAGDAAEFEGLKETFGVADGAARPWCALGSIKSQIGHTKSAAGAASLAKVVAALHHKVLPPTINVRAPNPKLGIEGSPFYLNTKARPWIRGADHPRRASISSFGFGGTNFHMTLEEPSGSASRPAKYRTFPNELFLVSDASSNGLLERVRKIVEACRYDDDLPHCAATSQTTFDVTEAHRLAFVIGSRDELAKLAESVSPKINEGHPFSTQNAVYARAPSDLAAGKTAFLFAGQGSQYLGMGADLAMAFDGVRMPWDQAAGDSNPSGARLHDLVFPPSVFTEQEKARQSAEMTRTENAQPAIGLVALGQLRLLRDLGLRPDCFAGHSFGEIMALHAAGALDAEAAIRLARARGEAMARAAETNSGGMLAVFADRCLVEDYLSSRSSDLVLANDNAPDQVIMSGPIDAIEAAEKELSDRGVRVRRLDVSTAFHSPLVAAATADLRAAIDEAGLRAPQLTVYANVTGAPYAADDTAARDLLTQQLAAPVRFRETIEAMYRDGVRSFIEVGPSSVLTGLVASTLKDRPHIAVALDQRQVHGVTALQQALAKLAAAGHALKFAPLWDKAPAPARRREPKQHEVMLNGANYGKPYPPQGAHAAIAEPADGPVLSGLRAAAAQSKQNTATNAVSTVFSGILEPVYEADMNNEARRLSLEIHDALKQEQRRFVEALSQSHMAFLRASETMLGQLGLQEDELGSAADLDQVAALSNPNPGCQPEHDSADAVNVNRYGSMVGGRPVDSPLAVPIRSEHKAHPRAEAREATELHATESVPAPVVAPLAAAALSATAETVRTVVAEKTGYPVDMLDLDMDLEAELGIDSIKQVEILSALREKLPSMPEIEPARLAELRTLQLIAEAIVSDSESPAIGITSPAAEATGTSGGSNSAEAVSQPPQVPTRDCGAALSATAETVRAVVAEKTGYPVDMLDLDMDLEAELGIDSIKQVEILSALREKLPSMPEIEPARLAELRTLQLIAEAIATPSDEDASAVQVKSQAGTIESGLSLSSFLRETSANGLYRQVVDLDAAPAHADRSALSSRDRIQITGEARALAEALAGALTAHGLNAEVVDEPSEDADAIIVTSGLADELGTPAVCRAALGAARKAAARMSVSGGCFVLLQDSGGDFGRTNCDLDIAARGGLTALAKTAAQEWPAAELRAIDVERQGEPVAETARRVVQELLYGGGCLEVGLPRDGRRLTPSAKPADYGDGSLALPNGANIVVSGGGRGITAQVVRRLACLGSMNFLILGRSELVDWPADIDPDANEQQLRSVLAENALRTGLATTPKEIAAQARQLWAAREVTQTLASVRAAGSEATYVSVDVTNASAVAAAVATFRGRHGPVTGVIHGAGQLADKLIKDKTDEQLERVMAPKVDGFRSLWSAVESDDPSFVALFSSFAGRSGNPGQADYAMANEILNRFAWTLRQIRSGMRVISVNWGPWLAGMVNEGVRDLFAERGIPLIPIELGADAFVAELFHGTLDNPEVVFAGEFGPTASRVDAPAAGGGGRMNATASLRQPLS